MHEGGYRGKRGSPSQGPGIGVLSVEKGFVKVSKVSDQKEHFVKEVLLLFLLVHKLELSAMFQDDLGIIVTSSTELAYTERDGEGIVELVW